jgi:hypothetical protein
MMAETVRSETLQTVADYLTGRMHFSQVNKSIRGLRDLNLIVVKPRSGAEDLLELHPVVRDFIRRTFPIQARIGFIDAILQVYLRFMGSHNQNERKSFYVLEHWTENAELCIQAGKLDGAFNCLADVGPDFYKSSHPGEYARVAKMLFQTLSWADYTAYKNFDPVFNTYFRILLNLGRTSEYLEAIKKYGETVQSKDVRYIRPQLDWAGARCKEGVLCGEVLFNCGKTQMENGGARARPTLR